MISRECAFLLHKGYLWASDDCMQARLKISHIDFVNNYAHKYLIFCLVRMEAYGKLSEDDISAVCA